MIGASIQPVQRRMTSSFLKILCRSSRPLQSLTAAGCLAGALAAFPAIGATPAGAQAAAADAPRPPVATREPFVVKSPNGHRTDDYYWLRDDDPKSKRPEIMAYLQAENAYTDAVLAPLASLRTALEREMRSAIVEKDSTVPVYRDGYWTWSRYDEGAEYPVLLRRPGGPRGMDPKAPEELLLDQPARAKGQPYYAVGGAATSPDGRRLAWVENTTGRRSYTLHIKDIASGRALSAPIEGVLEPLAWAADSATLFYVRQDPQTLQSGAVWRHAVGTPATQDVLVYEEADKTLFVGLEVSASRRYVRIHMEGYDTNELRVVPTDAPATVPRVVLPRQDKVRNYADHHAGRWVIRTNLRAVNFRLVEASDERVGDPASWRDLVPHRASAALEGFALTDAGVAFEERVQADTRVRLRRPDGRFTTVAAAPATMIGLSGNADPKAASIRYTVTNLITPTATYDFDPTTGQRTLRKQRVVPGFEPGRYQTARVWARARDGARIPVSLAWRRDLVRRDGRAPLLQVGYGAYGISYDPTFSSTRLPLLDRGFVFAIAHVRGGAELGQPWYEAGRLEHKVNTFHDFIDVTDHLVRERWGDPTRMFASGGSAGGLLMGAVANLAGMKYRGMILDVPFVDVVTTMLDETIPLTVNEWTQWGDPREAAAYERLLSYSPYDQLKAQSYPAMLVTTGLWDSQVGYWEPAKYVARLRTLKTNDTPLLLHTELEAGHGGRSGRFEYLKGIAREQAFLLDLAGLAGSAARR